MSFDYGSNFYSFACDYETPETTKKLNLYFYPRDNSFELYDIGVKRLLLKRTVVNEISLDDIYIGAKITVFSKILLVRDYANAETRRVMSNMKQRAFVMVKSEARNFLGEIIGELEKHKLFVKKLKMLKLQALAAVQFCTSKTSEDNISALMDNITSGAIVVLEVLGENAIEQLKMICGPADISEAKTTSPHSLRALYGLDDIRCAVLYPKDSESNQKDLEFFFPKTDDRLKVQAKLHRSTLCVIKPHAVREGKIGVILKAIKDEGFTVATMKMVHLDRKQCEEFFEIYKGVVGEYLQMVNQLQSGSCLAIEVQGEEEDIQPRFRAFCGPADPHIAKILRPKTLRAMFGVEKVTNAVHCTDLNEDTMLELEYFFKILG